MLRWRSLGLLLCGLSSAAVAGCKDEPAGPGVSDDTRWRVACARESDRGTCGLDQPSHGGPETAGDIRVSCEKEGSFLSIRLEDPGDSDGTTRRNRSILLINQINTSKNYCTVTVTEYDRMTGGEFRYQDVCAGNPNLDGKCEVEGEMNSDGYDFNGSIYCPALKLRNAGPADFQLENGAEQNEPVPLKIVNCG